MFFPDCAETVNVASKHSNATGSKIFLTNFGSEFTRIPKYLVIKDSLAREEVGPHWDSAELRIASALFASSLPLRP